MHLVDRDRRARRLRVAPALAARRRRSRRNGAASATIDAGRGRRLGRARRPGRPSAAAARRRGPSNLVLVERAGREPRDEHLPHARLVALAHRVAAPVPAVEVADHRDAPRVRRPHGEAHARHAVDPHRVRAEARGRDRDAGLRRADGGRDRRAAAAEGIGVLASPASVRRHRSRSRYGAPVCDRARRTGPAGWMRSQRAR